MDNDRNIKKEWFIDPLISPVTDWELYKKLMESKPLPKIDKDYKYKTKPPKK